VVVVGGVVATAVFGCYGIEGMAAKGWGCGVWLICFEVLVHYD
jgi:hypothetical protein